MIAYILPNRNGIFNYNFRVGFPETYQCVNDPVGNNDGLLSYIFNQNNYEISTRASSFKGYNPIFDDPNIEINSIKIAHTSSLQVSTGETIDYAYFRPFFYMGSYHYAPEFIMPPSENIFETYSYTWNKNPHTNQNWENTLQDPINNLEFGIVLAVTAQIAKVTLYCTQIYLEITYNEDSPIVEVDNSGSFLLNALNY